MNLASKDYWTCCKETNENKETPKVFKFLWIDFRFTSFKTLIKAPDLMSYAHLNKHSLFSDIFSENTSRWCNITIKWVQVYIRRRCQMVWFQILKPFRQITFIKDAKWENTKKQAPNESKDVRLGSRKSSSLNVLCNYTQLHWGSVRECFSTTWTAIACDDKCSWKFGSDLRTQRTKRPTRPLLCRLTWIHHTAVTIKRKRVFNMI